MKMIVTSTADDANQYIITETITKTVYTSQREQVTSSTRIKSLMNPIDDRKYPIAETVKRIVHLTAELTEFWKHSDGWAPIDAANILTKSRLDWQASLANQLRLFIDSTNNESGLLILAWATLGSLIEGVLKIFLSVYYKVYQSQNLTNEFKQVKDKKGNLLAPDGLMLEKLRLFFADRVFPPDAEEIWKKQGELNWLNWILKIQNRRNAIHAFKDREIGDFEEFYFDLQNYLIFLRKVNNALPYPDKVFVPVEAFSDSNSETIGVTLGEREIKGTIKQGKLHVVSKDDGEYLKKVFGIKEELKLVDELFFSEI